SPSSIKGSLGIVQEGLAAIGLRGVLCYEITDRGGERKRRAGLQETRGFLSWTNAASAVRSSGNASDHDKADESFKAHQSSCLNSVEQFGALIGAHASFTLSDAALAACARLMKESGAGLHIHVAEDRSDVDDAREKYGLGMVERLAKFGALNDQTILAHGVHL